MSGANGIDNRKIISGALWSAADSWGRQVVSLLILVVSARLLSPADFGLIAIPAILLMIKEASLDWALNETLVRRLDLTDALLTTAFWFSMLIGGALALVMVVGGDWIGRATAQPAFAEINAALAVCYPLGGAAAVFEAKLRHDLNFRALAIRPLVALSIAGMVALALIMAGFGAWALVAQIVIEKLVSFLLLFRVSPWWPSLSLSWPHLRALLPDFVAIAGAMLLANGARNLDRLAVGILLPSAVLGAYVLASRVAETAIALLLQGVGKAVYVLFTKLQNQREQLHNALNKASETTAIVAVPGFVGLSLVAPDAVAPLFGPQWAESGTLLQILVLAGVPQIITGYTNAVARATGKASWILANMGVTAAVTVLFLAAIAPFGPMAIAAVPLVRETAMLIVGLLIVRSVIQAPVAPLLRCLLPVFLSVAAMALVLQAVRPHLTGHVGPSGSLMICIFLGAATYAASMLLTARRPLARIWAFVRER